MPSPVEFAHAFGIHSNIHDTDLNIKCIKLKYSHDVIEKYKKYHIPFRFVFQSDQSMTKTLEWCKNLWGNQEKIVNSRWGNPYKCVIKNWNIEKEYDGVYVVVALGVATRIYN